MSDFPIKFLSFLRILLCNISESPKASCAGYDSHELFGSSSSDGSSLAQEEEEVPQEGENANLYSDLSQVLSYSFFFDSS